ncbi:MAG: DNA polymerase IV [Clostridia bacterium]|nr:DNA polymerase IV [Clostridia bacterium]
MGNTTQNPETAFVDKRALKGALLNRGRFVFHSDLNNFYASVECLLNPELRGHPVAVCGSCEQRHGIVLAKNDIAKKYGVKTAEVIWQAKKKCPNLVTVPANYERYSFYSHAVRKIYSDYTDKVEPFGADEAWLEITGHRDVHSFDEAKMLADEIRNRVYLETGLTVSIGVSYNKVFAKLASDYKKPDATTVFAPESYGSIIAGLPASDMIFVGKSTEAALSRFGVHTIGQLAALDDNFVCAVFGKNGMGLVRCARGEDTSAVVPESESEEIKSIGNSSTSFRDLESNDDVRMMCYTLSESVGARLRRHGLKCGTVQISIRESDLKTHEHQIRLATPTDSTRVIAEAACTVFASVYNWHKSIRSIGVRACNLTDADAPRQLSVFDADEKRDERLRKIDSTVDSIRNRFGSTSLQRAVVMCDSRLTGACVKGDF